MSQDKEPKGYATQSSTKNITSMRSAYDQSGADAQRARAMMEMEDVLAGGSQPIVDLCRTDAFCKLLTSAAIIQKGRTPGKSFSLLPPTGILTHEEVQKFYEIRRVPVARVILNEEHVMSAEALNEFVGKGSFVAMPDSWPGLSLRHDVSPMLMVDGVGKVEFRGVSVVDTNERDTVKIAVDGVQDIDFDKAHQHIVQMSAADFGISPEMLETMNRLSTSLANHIVNSSSALSRAVASKLPMVREAMQECVEHFSANFYKRDIYLSIRKEVYGMKPKRVLPSGSMRKRRRHYYSDLIKKNIEVEGKLLKNAYPVNAPVMSEPDSNGMVNVTMGFAFDKADAAVKTG